MKTSIWKRFFRCGWNRKSAIDNGWWAKHDAKSTRTKLNRRLDRLFDDKEVKYAPRCRHYKETYLECAICILDGCPCRLESGIIRKCDNYKEIEK